MADILLEAGTNEMELLVFRLADTFFGVNVAKVRELVQRVETVKVPHAPQAVEGSFRIREEVLSLVNLGKYLGLPAESLDGEAGLFIILELNRIRCGVLVDAVEMIHRLRWDDIEPPSDVLTGCGAPLTAVAKVDERVILILDFETILGELLGTGGVSVPEQDEKADKIPEFKDLRVLIVDDSATIRQVVENIMRKHGFEQLTLCGDGQHAWETLEQSKNGGGPLYDLVLSDIEMPRMDGLHLTARIKEDPTLRNTKVVLFSSIISKENANKGQKVGADAQVTKFDSGELLKSIQKVLGGSGT